MHFIWNKTRTTITVTYLTLAFAICGITAVAAKDALPGSADFRPSPEQPVGWRGDGSGKYPAASPPVHWGRVDKKMLGIKCLAAVPKDQSGKDATPVSIGFFSEWLVAGPITCSDTGEVNAISGQLPPGEAEFAPVAGDKIDDTTWKVVKVDDSYVDLWKAVGPMINNQLAYAQSCLYVENTVNIYAHLKHVRGATFWFNGKQMYGNKDMQSWWHFAHGPVIPMELKTGWNRFLFKISPETKAEGWTSQCYLRCRFWSAGEPREYQEKNIAWIAPMPGISLSSPIIVGDKIFSTAHPYNLVCVEKKTGKVLWVRSSSIYDALTPEERKENPEAAAKLDGMAAKRDAYYRTYLEGLPPGEQAVREQIAVEKEMDKLVLATWKEKYKQPKEPTDGEQWCVPTPMSDGQYVYVWNTFGLSASFDLTGNRRWIKYNPPLPHHHNFFGSPAMADGKFVVHDGKVTAYNVADGSQAWQVKADKVPYSNGSVDSLIRYKSGTTNYICGNAGLFIRAADGQADPAGLQKWSGTPVIDNDRLIFGTAVFDIKAGSSGVSAVSRGPMKPLAEKPIRPPGYQDMFRGVCGSPVIHEGLGYQVSNDGVLTVFDIDQKTIIYQKELAGDINSFSRNPWCNWWGGSLALAGPYIYVMSPTGITIVFKPGRQYEEVARNKVEHIVRADESQDGKVKKGGRVLGPYGINIYANTSFKLPYIVEQQESTIASAPIFEGKRMYYRGQENLYCIEEK